MRPYHFHVVITIRIYVVYANRRTLGVRMIVQPGSPEELTGNVVNRLSCCRVCGGIERTKCLRNKSHRQAGRVWVSPIKRIRVLTYLWSSWSFIYVSDDAIQKGVQVAAR